MQFPRREQTSVTDEQDLTFLGDNQAVCLFSKLTDVSDKSISGLIMLLVLDKYKIKSVKSVSRNKKLCRQSIKWPKVSCEFVNSQSYNPHKLCIMFTAPSN